MDIQPSFRGQIKIKTYEDGVVEKSSTYKTTPEQDEILGHAVKSVINNDYSQQIDRVYGFKNDLMRSLIEHFTGTKLKDSGIDTKLILHERNGSTMYGDINAQKTDGFIANIDLNG